jgi:hypothetical protein
MVAQLLPQPHPILACLDQAAELVQGVRDVQPLFMSPAEKTAAVERLARLEAMTAELKLRVVAAAGDAADEAGARDTGGWLATHTRADSSHSRAHARLAEALDRRWHRVTAAMADGVVSAAQARAVVDALQALPDDLDPALVGKAETQLVAWCADFRPDELRRLGRQILHSVAPDIADAELARRLQDEEQRAQERTSLRSRIIGDGLARTTITHPILDRDRLLTYLHAYTSPRKHDGAMLGEEDRIPHHRRMGHAFGALLEHLDPAKLPDHGGDTTTLMVTIGLESLRSELGTGTVIGGEPISAAAIRRLACEANIIPVVLGGKGQILDVGRARRLHPPHIRKALRLRDQHCRAEGCSIPAAWCEAHHPKPWSHGGNTSLANSALLCTWHHHRAHDPTYQADTLPNGDLRFHRRN